jgi:hypothetical protein
VFSVRIGKENGTATMFEFGFTGVAVLFWSGVSVATKLNGPVAEAGVNFDRCVYLAVAVTLGRNAAHAASALAAAARMFSGKQADKYGFTQVQVNRTEDGGYEATFRRGAMPAWMATLFAGFGAPGGSS